MKAVLVLLMEAVVMLFSAFGGFLTVVAPPPGASEVTTSVGLASFAILIIFASVKLWLAVVPPGWVKKITVGTATVSGTVFVLLGMYYLWSFDKYTFRFPAGMSNGTLMLAADELTPAAADMVQGDPSLEGAHAALLARAGEQEAYKIWPPSAVVAKRAEMMWCYIGLVATLALSLGFAVEGLLAVSGPVQAGRREE